MIFNKMIFLHYTPEPIIPYLTFSSPSSFTIAIYNATKNWDGTLEYSTDKSTWDVWDGTTTLTSAQSNNAYYLYMRGTGNTKISKGLARTYKMVITGSSVSCIGNIETLLDYEEVENGNHPTMASFCFAYLFCESTALINAPSLPSDALSTYCYSNMFYGCTSLTTAPAVPATTLADACYYEMFENCTSLVAAPALPATTLADYCYDSMFKNCTSLTTAPALPAATLALHCYSSMFYGCTSLTTASELTATTLANYCYNSMFRGCTSLTTAPALPATTLKIYCYDSMFNGCTSLVTMPILPATTLSMYCYNSMFNGCSQVKLSRTQGDPYTYTYRIPSSGTGEVGTNSLDYMFSSTGGTFTGTPTINTTYYTDHEPV